MDIPATLHQVARVLKTGGALRAKLHPFTYTLSELREELRSGGVIAVKNFIYRLYVLSHGVALHVAGVGFRFPLARRRCESFQTRRSIRRAMERAGFETIDTSNWETAIARPHAGNCWVEAMKRLG
jgi:ubiquinone/menaquinone biosynthesis C-methylase UbiE